MEELNVNFTIGKNEPLVADFKAFNEPPTIELLNTNYELLENKPSINDVELVGNKTADELGLATKDEIPDTSNLATKDEIPSLDGYVKNTDYAGIGGKAGVIKVSATYGFAVAPSNGYLAGISRTLEQFEATQSNAVISKGTLDNVLTQYSKTVLTTEADYNALETKDSNTLYLIEE